MPDGAACDLSVIIVNWNVRDLLAACLASLRDGPGVYVAHAPRQAAAIATAALAVEVIVVDNASQDGSAEMVARVFPWARLIRNAENRGFTAANNQALAQCRGRYVLFLNPDTRVLDDALAVMVAYMDAHPGVGVLGPRLFYADGSPQSSRRRFPTFAMALFESTPLAWHWPNNPWARRYHMAEAGDDVTQPVDWLVGAALMARRAALDQVGGFDEGFFMYSEELDWCRRAAAAGWRAVYLPTARVVHYEGKSSEQAAAARHIHFQTSKVRYFRKHHGPLVAGYLRAFLLASFAGEWLLEAAKWLLGSRRDLRRRRMSAYGQLLRTGLRVV